MESLKLGVEIALGAPVVLVLLYIVVRVVAGAWFYTKKQFNERNGG